HLPEPSRCVSSSWLGTRTSPGPVAFVWHMCCLRLSATLPTNTLASAVTCRSEGQRDHSEALVPVRRHIFIESVTYASQVTPSCRRCSEGQAASDLGFQHLLSHRGLSIGQTEVPGTFVRHGQQPANPAGHRVLGHRRLGKLAEFLQRRLA